LQSLHWAEWISAGQLRRHLHCFPLRIRLGTVAPDSAVRLLRSVPELVIEQLSKLSNVLETGDLRAGELHSKGLLHPDHECDVHQGIPAFDVFGRGRGTDHKIILIEDFLKNLVQSF
jgi:hypothetical protein